LQLTIVRIRCER